MTKHNILAERTPAPAHPDKPWTKLNSYAAGFTGGGTPGDLMYMIKDDIVYWEGGATGSIPKDAVTTFATIPPALAYLRPPRVHKRGACWLSTGYSGGLEFNTDGSIKAANYESGGTRSYVSLTTSYPIG